MNSSSCVMPSGGAGLVVYSIFCPSGERGVIRHPGQSTLSAYGIHRLFTSIYTYYLKFSWSRNLTNCTERVSFQFKRSIPNLILMIGTDAHNMADPAYAVVKQTQLNGM